MMVQSYTNRTQVRILVVIASNARRGAEIEGSRMAREMSTTGVDAGVVALAPAHAGTMTLDVEVLGRSSRSIAGWRALRRRARDSDVVVAYGSTTLPACSIALAASSSRVVYRSIGDPARWVRNDLHRRRTRVLIRRMDLVVPVWEGAARSLQKLYGIPKPKLRVIPNARSAEEFRPASIATRAKYRATLGADPDDLVVAMVGALTHEKRVMLGIDAVALAPEATLVIVGDGPLRSEVITHAAAALPGRHRFLGSSNDLSHVYAAADVLLITSQTEGMPGVALEAGLSGVPVVATAVGALPELFAAGLRGTAVGADPSPQEIAAALRATDLSGAVRRRATLSGFTWPEVARKWRAAIQTVTEGLR